MTACRPKLRASGVGLPGAEARALAALSGAGPNGEAGEFFLEREAAEAMIGEARADEPLLAQGLRVEAVELAY